MKPVNLKSLVIAHASLSQELRDDLFGLWGIKPKTHELVSLSRFVSVFSELLPKRADLVTRLLDGCYLGFSIPRISREFDCLWIGAKTVVNVELKSQEVDSGAIQDQLQKNLLYLAPLDKTVLSFTFNSSNDECYYLKDHSNLVKTSFKTIASALFAVHRESLFDGEIETLFSPDSYLVSPFNSTERFLEGQYFLTGQQLEFKNRVLQFIDVESSGCFCALCGGPGSGKSLLLYDIAQTLRNKGIKVLIGHSGSLNEGHKEMIENGWAIKSTKDMVSSGTNDSRRLRDDDIDVYLVDEAQRCYKYIIDTLINDVEKHKKKCVFSFDSEQIMSDGEQAWNNSARIRALVKENCFELTSSIRTNADVFGFVKDLFDSHHSTNSIARDHIEISYCKTVDDAKVLLDSLKQKGYRVPKFTPKLHGIEDYESWFPSEEDSAHEIIGQEFDNVVGLLSDKLYYNEDGKLVSRGRYLYREDRMLYQILTRARHKIHLVIVNNTTILARCLRLLNKNTENAR